MFHKGFSPFGLSSLCCRSQATKLVTYTLIMLGLQDMTIYYCKWRLFHGYSVEPNSCWLSDVVACPVCSLTINKQYVAVAALQPQLRLPLQFSHLVIILMSVCACVRLCVCNAILLLKPEQNRNLNWGILP